MQGRRGNSEVKALNLARQGRQAEALNLVTQGERVQAEGVKECNAGRTELKD